MKKLYTLVTVMIYFCQTANCQLTLDITPAIQAELDSIHELVLTSASMNTTLPYKVDNAQRLWMPPIFDQGSENSCVPSAEIGYTFTYEVNRSRNLPSDTTTNQYPVDFTYNFLNYGTDNAGTITTYPWKIVQQIGCPNADTYDPGGNGFIDETVWMTGYDKYFSGDFNKVDTIVKIKIWDDFNKLKHWLADHNEGDTSGGLATFTAYTNNSVMIREQIPLGEEIGKWIVSDWGSANGHEMTIVGYNDSIMFPLNNDSIEFPLNYDTLYRNDFDNNGDSVIDYRDWEIGAFKVANSWGAGWDFSNQGYIYVPYRKVFEIGGQSHATHVYIVKVFSQFNPEIVLKLNIMNQKRSDLLFSAGYAENTDSIGPTLRYNYEALSGTGGNFPMLGYANHNPLEISLDYKDIFRYDTIHIGKIFFQIKQQGYTNGTVEYLSIVDHRWGETIEIPCEMADFPYTTQHGYNTFWFNYDVLPFTMPTIGHPLEPITTNKVVRKQTVLVSGTLSVESLNTIDFYNSELVIDSGATLNVGNLVQFHAKQGNCKITVNGNIQLGSNVSFVAEPGASLEINFKNIGASISLDNCTIENVKMNSVVSSLTIDNNSTITNSLVDHKNGYFTLDNSALTTSTVKCTDIDLTGINVKASITENTFNQGYDMENSVVSISGYPHYAINDNTIINNIITVGTYYGLFVSNSGGSSRNEHSISNNEIYSQQTCMSPQCPAIPIGMGIYNSYATLTKNNVHHNYLGVECLNNTQITMVGEDTATYVSQTQRFINNYSQIYVSQYGFPASFIYNAIFNYDYTCQILIKHDVANILPMVNVTNNYWGTNFNPAQNLYPAGHYNYLPVWNLQEGGSATQSAASLMFETGLEQVADSNYTDAKNTFKDVVSEYPEEEPAMSAMKEMLYLEPIADNDFSGLKTWYLTEESIQENENLLKLAGKLTVKCDEKLENYQDAIDWYENEIENPPSLEDSVFAIIDLEHVYLLMGIDTNLRSSAYVGRLMQYKPESLKAHEQHRNELLALLLGFDSQDTNFEEAFNENNKLNSSQLLQNRPNPFSNTTSIQFNLNSSELSNVEIRIHDQVGKEVQRIPVKSAKEGVNTIELNMQGLPSGIYYYSLIINGDQTDTKKMVVGR